MPFAETVQSTPADRRSGPARNARSRVAAGDDEVGRRFEEIGLSPRTGWYASIALYLAGSIPAIALPLIAPDAFPRELMWLGVIAFLMVPLSYVGLTRFPNSVKATHLRLGIGFAIQATGAAAIGDALTAFAMLPLVTVLPPAIYFGVREATAYLVLAAPMVATALALLSEPWAGAMAVCSTTAIAAVSISMMVAQARTRRIARQYRALAYSDPLTGLANMRLLHERLVCELASIGDPPSALFAVDLDNFKTVNDELGYAMGDALLVATAKALERVAAESDLVARRGGDEFSVLVSDTRERDLDALAAEFSSAIVEARHWNCPGITPTASVDYVRIQSDDSVGSLLERADDALHERKSEFHSEDATSGPRLAALDQRFESERAETEMTSVVAPMAVDEAEFDDETLAQKMRGAREIDRPIWLFATAMQSVVGAALVTVGLLDLAPGFDAIEGLAFGATLLAAAAASALAGVMPLTHRLVNLSFFASIAVLASAVASAGASGAALLDLFAIPALFAYHCFQRRAASSYLLAIIGIYGYLSISGSFPFAESRLAVFSIAMLSSATLLGKVRTVTSRFLVRIWELSQRDALTGAANVRALRTRLREVTKQSRQSRSIAALIAIDLDEFKQVNDRFNHSTGDATLVAVARAIEDNVRADDLVARRGGDEFVVALHGVERRDPNEIADRIAGSIAHARTRICPGLVAGASVTWVECESGDDADALLARADRALHDRKVDSRRSRISAAA